MLPQYKKAPSVTRTRLYLDAIESMLSKSSKILVNVKGGNNIIYLPLDKLLPQQAKSVAAVKDPLQSVSRLPTPPPKPVSTRRIPARVGYSGGSY